MTHRVLHLFSCAVCSKSLQLEDSELWRIDGHRCPPYWKLLLLPVGSAPAHLREGGWLAPSRIEHVCNGCFQRERQVSVVGELRQVVRALDVPGETVEEPPPRQLPPATKKRSQRRGGSGKRRGSRKSKGDGAA